MAQIIKYKYRTFRPYLIDETCFNKLCKELEIHKKLRDSETAMMELGAYSFKSIDKTGIGFLLSILLFGVVYTRFQETESIIALIATLLCTASFLITGVLFGSFMLFDYPEKLKFNEFIKHIEVDIKYSKSRFSELSKEECIQFSLDKPYDIFRGRQKQRYPHLFD